MNKPIERKLKLRIGDLLVQAGLLNQTGLERALFEQKSSSKRLGRVLSDMGLVTEQQIANAVAEQLGLRHVHLGDEVLPQEATSLLSEIQARRFRSIVLSVTETKAEVGMVDPTDFTSFDELSRILRREVEAIVVVESELMVAIEANYHKTEEINILARELHTEVGKKSLTDMSEALGLGSATPEDAPVVRLLTTVFEEAVRLKASDIHVEPMESKLRIRFRIDGELHVQTEADVAIAPAVALRLKLAAELNISEKRLPQDGRMKISMVHGAIDVRVSTMPTQYGESVVMRLLNQGSLTLSLSALGLTPRMKDALARAMKRPSGMILVTGPTGSGKTTTLYGALGEVNTTSRKVLTAEDPIEYRLPGLNQVQVNEKIGLTFERVLRSTLRQDPDVVLVGEIRDAVTADIAMRAAMTGHLVLSTIHSNDAPSTPVRLLDMGVPAYMVALSLQLIVAQRLIKKLCNRCSVPHQVGPDEERWIQSTWGKPSAGEDSVDLGRLRRSVGCKTCHQTGYLGRQPVFEFIEMNQTLISAMSDKDPNEFVRKARSQMAGMTMAREALALAMRGITSLEQAQSVDSGIED